MLLIGDNTNRVRVNQESKFVLERVKELRNESFEQIVWFALEIVYPDIALAALREFEPSLFEGEN